MPETYEKIATYTVTGSATSSIDITSIPGTYTDLRVILSSATGAAFDDEYLIRLNSDTGNNYSMTILGIANTTVASSRRSNVAQWHIDNNTPSNVGGMAIMEFLNYSNTTTNKTMINRSGRAGLSATMSINLWRNTAAITSINFRLASSLSYQVGTTIAIYGIKAA
jgi:hypothetical protein